MSIQSFQRGEWHEVAMGLLRGGGRLVASGVVTVDDVAALRVAFESMGLHIKTEAHSLDKVAWVASRYEWAIRSEMAVCDLIPVGELRHVLLGLLYGYGSAEIDQFLSREASPEPPASLGSEGRTPEAAVPEVNR